MRANSTWCLICCRILDVNQCLHVFRTGFKQIDGVNYPLAICSQCGEHSPLAHRPEQGIESPHMPLPTQL